MISRNLHTPDNSPLISVAIPAYRHEKFIRECLMSVHDQSYQNLELVVIDDGSPDRTAEVIHDFISTHGKRFVRTTFKSRPNRGVSATSNECIHLCQGEWVHLLGSDDLMAPHKVMAQWQSYLEWDVPDLALIYGDAGFIDEEGNPMTRSPGERPPPGPVQQGHLQLFLANRIPNPTVALRRKAVLEIGGFDESLFLEDWDCWLRLSARYPIGRVPEEIAYYRYHGENTHKKQAEMLEAMLLSFGKFIRDNPGSLTPDIIRRNWRKNLHRLSRWARKAHPATMPHVAIAGFKSLYSLPVANDYFRFAEFINRRKET
jgi:alpha-1,3-rhamnosyltransferase